MHGRAPNTFWVFLFSLPTVPPQEYSSYATCRMFKSTLLPLEAESHKIAPSLMIWHRSVNDSTLCRSCEEKMIVTCSSDFRSVQILLLAFGSKKANGSSSNSNYGELASMMIMAAFAYCPEESESTGVLMKRSTSRELIVCSIITGSTPPETVLVNLRWATRESLRSGLHCWGTTCIWDS